MFGLVAGCGSDDPAEMPTQSCTIKNIGNVSGTDACTDYVGWPSNLVLMLCSVPGSTYSSEACPTSKRIGGCRGSGSGTAHYIRWYYPRTDAAMPATAADVMADCASTSGETYVAP